MAFFRAKQFALTDGVKRKKYPPKDLTPEKCTTSRAYFLAVYVTVLFCIAWTLCHRHFYLINMLYIVSAWQLVLYFVFQGGKKWLGDIDAWGHAMDSADPPGMTNELKFFTTFFTFFTTFSHRIFHQLRPFLRGCALHLISQLLQPKKNIMDSGLDTHTFSFNKSNWKNVQWAYLILIKSAVAEEDWLQAFTPIKRKAWFTRSCMLYNINIFGFFNKKLLQQSGVYFSKSA